MPNLATTFALILTGLQAAIAPLAARDWSRPALLVRVWSRLSHASVRFERLFTRWREGTLPAPRPSRAGQPTTRAQKKPGVPAGPVVPGGRAWLVVMVRETAGFASQLQHLLLTNPDIADFLAACPQAGRILRPLCHMLGIPRPPALPAPPPRPPRARKAKPPTRPAKAPTSRRHLPLWEPAPLRNFVRR